MRSSVKIVYILVVFVSFRSFLDRQKANCNSIVIECWKTGLKMKNAPRKVRFCFWSFRAESNCRPHPYQPLAAFEIWWKAALLMRNTGFNSPFSFVFFVWFVSFQEYADICVLFCVLISAYFFWNYKKDEVSDLANFNYFGLGRIVPCTTHIV